MLTRLLIDNFRCFENFEYQPGRTELIMGSNGSGKSSLFDALLFLRQIVVEGHSLDQHSPLAQRTRWIDRSQITFSLEVKLADYLYTYSLVLGEEGDIATACVKSETLSIDGNPLFEFVDGEVRLFNDQSHQLFNYPFDWRRSALATIMPRKDNTRLSRFKLWLRSLYGFRINPFAMAAPAEAESSYIKVDLSNFAAWYRFLVQTQPNENSALLLNLRACMDGFSTLRFESLGQNRSLLVAEFLLPDGKYAKFYFNELSDGQRCLIALYTILHFILAKGSTVLIDEPDNFLSLRETQPWLSAVENLLDEKAGQLLIISHHPEIIDQWAPGYGTQFVRDGCGPVRVQKFVGDPDSPLAASELIARGWDRD
jgi:predicted ATPase